MGPGTDGRDYAVRRSADSLTKGSITDQTGILLMVSTLEDCIEMIRQIYAK